MVSSATALEFVPIQRPTLIPSSSQTERSVSYTHLDVYKRQVVPVNKMIEVSKDPRFGNTKALLLFETPQDALRAIEGGVDIKELNIGSMAHSVGKVAVSKVV